MGAFAGTVFGLCSANYSALSGGMAPFGNVILIGGGSIVLSFILLFLLFNSIEATGTTQAFSYLSTLAVASTVIGICSANSPALFNAVPATNGLLIGGGGVLLALFLTFLFLKMFDDADASTQVVTYLSTL